MSEELDETIQRSIELHGYDTEVENRFHQYWSALDSGCLKVEFSSGITSFVRRSGEGIAVAATKTGDKYSCSREDESYILDIAKADLDVQLVPEPEGAFDAC